MEQLGGVKLAFVSLELDEECVVKKKRLVSDDWWGGPIKRRGSERTGKAEYRFIWDNELLNLHWSDEGIYRKPKRSEHVNNTKLQTAILFVFIDLLRRTNFLFFFRMKTSKKIIQPGFCCLVWILKACVSVNLYRSTGIVHDMLNTTALKYAIWDMTRFHAGSQWIL